MRASEWSLLVALSVLWGGTFFFVAVALPEVPPLTLVLARVALAALVLVPLALALGYGLPRTPAAWRTFAVLALLNNVIPFTLIAFGQTRIASGLASVLNATTPLFTLVVARLLAGEVLTWNRLAGVVLGMAGVGVLMRPDAAAGVENSPLGMACVLGGALSYGFAALWMRRLQDTPPLVSSAAQLVCSAVLMLPLAVWVEGAHALPMPGVRAIAAVVALAVLSTALAYIVFFRISATAGPANVMLVTLLIPVTATALGVLVLGEPLTASHVLGALIIGAGLVVIDGRVLGRWRRVG